jgi:hypothetical protein
MGSQLRRKGGVSSLECFIPDGANHYPDPP